MDDHIDPYAPYYGPSHPGQNDGRINPPPHREEEAYNAFMRRIPPEEQAATSAETHGESDLYKPSGAHDDGLNGMTSEIQSAGTVALGQEPRRLVPFPIKGLPSSSRLGLNPEAKEFSMLNGSSQTDVTLSNAPSTETAAPSTETHSPTEATAPKEPIRAFLPRAPGFSNSGPITWDPNAAQLPYKEFTDESPECAAIGKYLSRPLLLAPTHPFMTSSKFTLIIRFEGAFDRNGRQPGLVIPQTTHFTLRVLEHGYVPGERKVEIWRNGETLQLFGLIGLFADECGWFLGDKELRQSRDGRYSGREEGMRLAERVSVAATRQP